MNCFRGELCLTDIERFNIEQYLAAISVPSGGLWRLVAVPESASAVGRKTRKGSAVKRGAVSAVSAPHAASQERQRRQSTTSHHSVAASHQPELPKTRSTRQRNATQSFGSDGGEPIPEDSKGAPSGGLPSGDAADWPKRMQRILLELCKQPVCLPFLPRVSPTEAHYAELARKVYPAVPLSLETVLERLESGEYSRSLDVFNDVYSVFMCAFRYYEPGNQYWMMAQEASLAFGALTMGEPLCNAFAPASVSHDTASQEWGRAGEEAWDSGAKGGKNGGTGKMAGKTRPTRTQEAAPSAVHAWHAAWGMGVFLAAPLCILLEDYVLIGVCVSLGYVRSCIYIYIFLCICTYILYTLYVPVRLQLRPRS